MDRSSNACFALVLASHCSVAVPPGCAVFVRRGSAAWQTRSSDVLLDVNHALLVPVDSGPGVVTASELGAALTIIRESSVDAGSAPTVRLIDSGTFLEHYRLFFGGTAGAGEIVSRLRDLAEKPSTRSARSPSYGRSMQMYLNATLAQPFSLRSVAQACALSPFTASRVFHREAGIPLRTYARRLRLRTSLGRIDAKRDLSQVALELGFFDHSHFTRAFRAEFGIAPSQWRDFVSAALGIAA
jgi:AraC-like DNA-binding protein